VPLNWDAWQALGGSAIPRKNNPSLSQDVRQKDQKNNNGKIMCLRPLKGLMHAHLLIKTDVTVATAACAEGLTKVGQ